MISITSLKDLKQILCIGAHPDDIEIGCGGALLRLIEENPTLKVRWLILSGGGTPRETEAQASASKFSAGNEAIDLQVHGFKDAHLPWQGADVKQVFENEKGKNTPDLIFTHFEQDRHQDHRLISELTWNTWRDHLILEYEVIKWDGDLGNPNFYLPLSSDISSKKVNNLCEAYPSQHARQWFKEENFLSLMRVRGVECNSEFAEAFYVRKMRW